MEEEQAYVPTPELEAAARKIVLVDTLRDDERRGKDWWGSIEKQIFERIVATIGIISPLGLPVMMLASVAILTFDRQCPFILVDQYHPEGPVRLLKHRSMKIETPSSQLLVTPLGKILRANSIDEIPQWANILAWQQRYHLALVGIRPFSLEEWREVISEQQKNYPYNEYVQALEVGTPLAALDLYVVLGRKTLSFEDRCILAACYREYGSFRGDLNIILHTLGAVRSRTGAY